MKIEKREYEDLVRDSEKLRCIVAIALADDNPYIDRSEVLRICGFETKKVKEYVA